MAETSQRTTRYIWPTEAERLVAQGGASQQNTALLHQKLLALTGFSHHACWRYLQKFGIKRPGAGKRVQWNPKTVDFVIDQGYDAAVQKFNTSKKAVYRFMQRNERVMGACRGQYNLNQLRKLLSVRTETIGSWIKAGYLEATPFQYGGKETYIVSDDQLRKFLKPARPTPWSSMATTSAPPANRFCPLLRSSKSTSATNSNSILSAYLSLALDPGECRSDSAPRHQSLL